MKYMVNCSSRPDKEPRRIHGLNQEGPANESWQLIQKRVVVEFAFKVGKVPGIPLLMECESEEEARSHIEQLPSVRDGWVDYQIDPISAAAKFA
jgi:hypothetical protein